MTSARLLVTLAIPILSVLTGAGCVHIPAEVSEKALEKEFRRLALLEKKNRASTRVSSKVTRGAARASARAELESAPRIVISAQDLARKGPDLFGPWMIMESVTPIDDSLDTLPSPNLVGQQGGRMTASFAPSTNSGFRTMKPEALTDDPDQSATPTTPNISKATAKKIKQKVDEAHLIFDFPVTYNSRVRKWIRYFQTTGRPSFRRWLERSTRYIPYIQGELQRAGLPTDIAYVAMIESGFSSSAVSHAHAMGMWQFIAPTGKRYGLGIDWWIDERRDFEKATRAAIGYMSDLFEQFGSWYLVAASYNMGEGGVRRLINRHKTNSFWDLADRGALPEETRNYLPKMLAAMLIAKAPALYGFRDLDFQLPFSFEFFDAPGGTDLVALASHLGVSERSLTELNPELLKGFIPREVKSHRIRIPKGSRNAVAQFLNVGRSN